MFRILISFAALLGSPATLLLAQTDLKMVWPAMAPGETTTLPGTELAPREADKVRITRVEKISQPTIDTYLAEKPNGVSILILPGGGFRYVVPDLEGSEAAKWLNSIGISAFVLRYRTTEQAAADPWRRPLQDSQRAIRLIRRNAASLKIDPNKVGLLGFSAGGQVAAIHLTQTQAAYDKIDDVDNESFMPNHSILIYPWRIFDDKRNGLVEPIQISKSTPPAFIVHTHDDGSTSLGAVYYYAGLKQNGIAAELHVYQNGGHGYGTRTVPNSLIGTWKDRATEWLKINSLAN